MNVHAIPANLRTAATLAAALSNVMVLQGSLRLLASTLGTEGEGTVAGLFAEPTSPEQLWRSFAQYPEIPLALRAELGNLLPALKNLAGALDVCSERLGTEGRAV